HLARPYVWTFFTGATADLTPPGVLATLPADGTADWAPNRILVVTFDEPIDSLTVSTSTFTLAQPGPVPVHGSVATVGSRITFQPDNALTPGVVYTAPVTAGVADLAGNVLGADRVFTFTAGASPDALPPTVLATNPADAAVAVAVNGMVCVSF